MVEKVEGLASAGPARLDNWHEIARIDELSTRLTWGVLHRVHVGVDHPIADVADQSAEHVIRVRSREVVRAERALRDDAFGLTRVPGRAAQRNDDRSRLATTREMQVRGDQL